MKITESQIKAGRALLEWTQEDLAAAAGISKPALANIERRHVAPRAATLNAIRQTMEAAGLEFTDGPGVRLAEDRLDVTIFRGADSIEQLWEDILMTLQPGEERLISCVDESRFLGITHEKFHTMMKRYEEVGITGRILSLKGDVNFVDPTSEYKWVPKTWFLDVSYYVYGDKYAVLIWEPFPRVVIIQNKAMADTYRAQFNRHWDAAETPSSLYMS